MMVGFRFRKRDSGNKTAFLAVDTNNGIIMSASLRLSDQGPPQCRSG